MPKELISYQYKNEKQNYFNDIVLECVILQQQAYRHFFYGGAIRGGKTYVCLWIFVQLARAYPGSRWHVIREDNPALESTTIPSLEKMIGKVGNDFKWIRSSGNKHVAFANGSKIFFKSENIRQDPTLNEFLGLETNGILLEQMEGLTETLYKMAIQRIGSWYIDPMPAPLLLGTFNPTPLWPKKIIYDRFIKNELPDNVLFVEALPEDNPFVTPEQFKNWDNLDEQSFNQMIKGIWRFLGEGNIWAYSFRPEKHVIDILTPEGAALMAIDKRLPLYLIFDFNVDPITCLVAQRYQMEWGKIIKEYRLRNSDIFELLERIKVDYPDAFFIVTGDASGRNRTAITRGNKSFVQIIKTELNLSERQVQFPSANTSVSNTRIVVNSVLSKHKKFYISSACNFLIDDLMTIKTDGSGGILDKKKEEKSQKTHLLDNLRYFLWNYFRKFVNLKL